MKDVSILETRKTQKDLAKAPERIIKAYEIWATLIETHGTQILKSFPGYLTKCFMEHGRDIALPD